MHRLALRCVAAAAALRASRTHAPPLPPRAAKRTAAASAAAQLQFTGALADTRIEDALAELELKNSLGARSPLR